MPEQQPRNYLELINLNIVNLGKNQKTQMDEIAAMRKEVAELRAMLITPPAPEQPNVASGEEGAKTEE